MSRLIPAGRLVRILAIVTVLLAGVVVVTAVASDAGPRRSPKPDAEEHEEVVKHTGALTGSCGVERWSVKTGTDADAGAINLQSTTQTTIASLDAIPAPSSLPANNRVKPTETTVYQLHATLTQYKLEADSDYHLVLSDGSGHTMIGEIPDPTCVGSGSPLLSGIQKARGEFDAEYTATGSFKTANVPVTITGVGFFDFDHGQTGVAPNAIELHAVLDIQFGSGTNGTQLLGNPGFETGTAAPWSTGAGVISNSSSEAPHSGSWDAWLDGKGTTHTDTLSQQVTIPASASTATLSFWLHIDTAETGTTVYDTLKVQILNGSGTVVATPATYSNADHATGYTQHTVNLAAYIGQTITLRFTGSEDYTEQTSFVLDDTALTAG